MEMLLRSTLSSRVRVVLVEPEIGGNVGFVARVMKNFGLQQLCLVNPVEGYEEEAKRFASRAKDIIEKAVVVKELKEAIDGVDIVVGTTAIAAKRTANILRTPTPPEELAKSVYLSRGSVALLFGRESTGLRNEELALCDFVATIPASNLYPTLNVSHAAAIIFYELFKHQRPMGQGRAADPRVRELVVERFVDLMKEAGYQQHRINSASRALRNILGRAFVTKREATLILGAFSKALAALKRRSELG